MYKRSKWLFALALAGSAMLFAGAASADVAPEDESGGCDCSAAAGSRSAGSAWVALIALGALSRRRLRART